MILGVLNQKGGVGKTTVCLNLAAFYAMAGVRVLVVDADPQASALAWSNAREAPHAGQGLKAEVLSRAFVLLTPH